MSLLRALFGPSKAEIWRQLADATGGVIHPGGFLSKDVVQAVTGDWILTLDTLDGDEGTTTRLRAPYVNPEGFRFSISSAGPLSGVATALGAQDVEVGHPDFDRAFVVRSNDPGRVRQLLQDDHIRELCLLQSKLDLQVIDDEGWFGSRFPDGVDELRFHRVGLMKDLDELRALFDLFSIILHELCHQGRAYEEDVALHIDRLSAPGGVIRQGQVLWDGDGPRRDAARALGRLRDPKALDALAMVLADPDLEVRALAIDAMTTIAHEGAIRPLIPLLGDGSMANGRRIRDHAAEALRVLGEGALADAVMQAMAGRREALAEQAARFRVPVLRALEGWLEHDGAIHAAPALEELRALESLSALRAAQRFHRPATPAGEAIRTAVEALSQHAALPRPVTPTASITESLPRPAGEPGPDPRTLPRQTDDHGSTS